jgi:tetratricopeptide (TPR) repeat protein
MRAISPDYSVYADHLADVLDSIAESEHSAGTFEAARASREDCLRLAIDRVAASESAPAKYQVANQYCVLAALHERHNDQPAAQAAFRQSKHWFRQALAAIDPDARAEQYAEFSLRLGEVCDALGQSREAADYFDRSQEHYWQLSREFPEVRAYREQLAAAVFWLARMQSELNRPQAPDTFERACTLAAQLVAEDQDGLGQIDAAQVDTASRVQLQRCHIVYARHLAGHSEPAKARPHYASALDFARQFLARNPDNRVWQDTVAECERALAETR